MGNFNEDNIGRRQEKRDKIPDELGRDAEEPGGKSGVGSETTIGTIDDMLSHNSSQTSENSYDEPGEDVSAQWGGAEATRIDEEPELSEEYFGKLNSELMEFVGSPNMLEGIVETENFLVGRRDYDSGIGVSAGNFGGKKLSASPHDQNQIYSEIADKLESVTSSHGPERLMTFIRIAEEEEVVEQSQLYDKRESLAQPTISLQTDDWEEEGLIEKYGDGSLETTELGDAVYELATEVEKDMYKEG